ncbi:MAG: hypothetical protein QF793_02420 [Candidatus Peribacteraceae bacterium]|jgi:hypothetical protein|nr:hypothetical protein [bacterium]MDP6561758.1 hypothetical protein [Candidatus Peribacteraceae bacterium]
MNVTKSDHDRIVRLTEQWLGPDDDYDGITSEKLGGSLTVIRGSAADLPREHCRASLAFVCNKEGSRKDLRWLAELSDNGEKPASMQTVNYRRDVTGSAEILSTMSDPSLPEVLDVLQHAIDSRD